MLKITGLLQYSFRFLKQAFFIDPNIFNRSIKLVKITIKLVQLKGSAGSVIQLIQVNQAMIAYVVPGFIGNNVHFF